MDFPKDRIAVVSSVALILSTLSAKKETEVKLGRPLQLCGIFALCPSEVIAVEQSLRLFIENIGILPFPMGSSTPA